MYRIFFSFIQKEIRQIEYHIIWLKINAKKAFLHSCVWHKTNCNNASYRWHDVTLQSAGMCLHFRFLNLRVSDMKSPWSWIYNFAFHLSFKKQRWTVFIYDWKWCKHTSVTSCRSDGKFPKVLGLLSHDVWTSQTLVPDLSHQSGV